MAGSPKKRLALDANLLLDLAEGKDFAHEFRDEFHARGYELLVPPTAAGELNVLSASTAANLREPMPVKSCSSSAPGNASRSRCRTPISLSQSDSVVGCWN